MRKYLTFAIFLFAALTSGTANAQGWGWGGGRPIGGGYGGNPYANVQRWGQQMGLQQKQFDLGTDCTDYGYGDCAERMARSGNPQGPGWMITGSGGYGGGWGGGGGQFYQQQWGGYQYQSSPRIIGWQVCDPYGRCWTEGVQ